MDDDEIWEAEMSERKQGGRTRRLLVKITRVVAALVITPILVVTLTAWTLLGRLCSMGTCSVFLLVAALIIIPAVVEPTLGIDDYAFDNSLLDPVCVLFGMYAVYMLSLRSHESSVDVAENRRMAALVVALCVGGFFMTKIAAVSEGDAEMWKAAWLWLSLVGSILVYVSMARWWTDTSIPRLQLAEEALLAEYGQVDFEMSVVAGLGTVAVTCSSVDPEAVASKPILVLLHGYAAGNGFWMFVLKDLSAHFNVVCVEMYGCGRSDRLPFNAKGPTETERLLVESLEKWRAAMGIEDMVLCGHSLGGMIASAYAMAHPKRLRKLVLASPAGVGGIPIEGDGGGNSFFYRAYAFLWTRGVGPLFLLRWCGPFGSRMARVVMAKRLSWVPRSARIRDVDPDLLGEYVFQLLALPASGEKIIFPLLSPMLNAYRPVVETLKGGSEVEAADGGGGINCPVSIIYGSPDQDWMPHSHGVDLAERLTRQGIRANVYSVPDAGHTLILDNPKDFTRIFLEAYFAAAGAEPIRAA